MTARPLVDWPAATPARPAAPHAEARLHALIVGGCVPALIACAALWLHGEWFAVVAAAGIPIGAVLAVEGAGRIRTGSWPMVALRAALVAPLLAAALVILAMVVGGLGGELLGGTLNVEDVASGLFMGLVVLVYALMLGLPVTVPAALVAGFLVHRAATLDRSVARLHVLALIVGTIAAGALTLVGVVWR